LSIESAESEDKPRFTTAELKEVLAERNELKHRINDLEEELANLRPPVEPAKIEPTPIAEEDRNEDRPVQGPLPYEPEDAPWKKTESNSGIRKFFRKLFLDNNSSPEQSFSKRSLSSWSKFAMSSGANSGLPL